MPLTLSDTKKEEIFRKIKSYFSDFQYFDLFIASGLRKLIDDSTQTEITKEFMKESLMQNYIDNPSLFQSKDNDKKEIFDRMEIILTASAVYLYSLNDQAASHLINSVDELLDKYPQWKEQLSRSNSDDEKELQLLLNFRNYMKLASILVNPTKMFLLRVVERLEGGNNVYITGTGQRIEVTRRSTDIYHTESGKPLKRKPERRADAAPRKITKSLNNVIDPSHLDADFDIDPATTDVLMNEAAYYHESFTELIANHIKPTAPQSVLPIVGMSSNYYRGSLTEEIQQCGYYH